MARIFKQPRQTDKPADFKHEPLDLTQFTIRVLSVLPGCADSTISCKLWHAELAKIEYTCLSYMWGTDAPAHVVLINNAPLKIRTNLYNFLRQAYKLGISEPLWIDAICIDQSNIAERNHQVQQMSSIYSHAKRVIIYPGLLHWPSRLQPLISSFNKVWSAEDSLFQGVEVSPSWRVALCHPLQLLVVRRVNKMRYWSRLWIVQEILLAQNSAVVMIGVELMQWEDFRTFFDGIGRHKIGKALGIRFDSYSGLPYLALGSKHLASRTGMNFLDVLSYFREQQCLEVRDRVYALSSILPASRVIKVDYSEEVISTMFRVALQLGTFSFSELFGLVEEISISFNIFSTLLCISCFMASSREKRQKIWSGDIPVLEGPEHLFEGPENVSEGPEHVFLAAAMLDPDVGESTHFRSNSSTPLCQGCGTTYGWHHEHDFNNALRRVPVEPERKWTIIEQRSTTVLLQVYWCARPPEATRSEQESFLYRDD